MHDQRSDARRARRARLALALALAAAALAACQDAVSPAPRLTTPGAARAAGAPAPGAGDVIPGQYIVVFDDATPDPEARAREKVARHRGALAHTFRHAVRGFAARLSDDAVDALRADPDVRYVEPDRRVRALGTQAGATWGLDRVDQRDVPLSASYSYTLTGAGVNAYIIDTGVRLGHADFGGRAVSGYDAVDGGSADDCNGHGTHVAGTVGGAASGVAKGARLWAVRVLDCQGNGTASAIVAGVDWVTGNHVKPAVANMSLGGVASAAIDDAVRRSVAAGVVYAAAAGNGDAFGVPADACGASPARVAEALTVGATDQGDGEAAFSNFGPCVDLLAPGVAITSAGHQGDTQLVSASGTSMAAPHVAGAAALYLEGHPAASPAAVAAALLDNAGRNKVLLHTASVSGGTANRLLYTGFLGGDAPTSNAPPTAGFSVSCAGLTCTFTNASTDADGTIAAAAWRFGDGTAAAAGQPAAHAYPGYGSYTASLTVTDDAGARATLSRVVTVTNPGAAITLSTRAYKEKGRAYVSLAWGGAQGASVDIYRNGARIRTWPNQSTYTDALDRASGTFTYKLCEAGTTRCSAASSVTI
jgi:subtilisin family serine protease